MKLYKTESQLEGAEDGAISIYREFTSSATDASKVRTRLKKLEHEEIKTVEIEIDNSRSGLIKFLNGMSAHPSWVTEPVADAVKG